VFDLYIIGATIIAIAGCFLLALAFSHVELS
jgi:hypothetical protein